jgi:4-diphosphocytidyl-2-C-methyl-D-erythritol kinase
VPERLTEPAPAKVNLYLHLTGRRDDGYHLLDSLVVFAGIGDTLSVARAETLSLRVTGPFATGLAGEPDNLVLRAARALAAATGVAAGANLVLDKHLPVASGIGGGSADAAAALRLLARVNGIAAGDARLMDAARAVGADVPACLASRPCIMRGVGEKLAQLDMPRLPAVLVNPGVALGTRDVFAKFAGLQGGAPIGEVPRTPEALLAFLARHRNDLTPAAIACAPIIDDVLAQLREAPGSLLARMSGSGATCFALFASAGEAAAAVWRVQNKHKDWWTTAATIG